MADMKARFPAQKAMPKAQRARAKAADNAVIVTAPETLASSAAVEAVQAAMVPVPGPTLPAKSDPETMSALETVSAPGAAPAPDAMAVAEALPPETVVSRPAPEPASLRVAPIRPEPPPAKLSGPAMEPAALAHAGAVASAEDMRQALAESIAATGRGAAEVNGKVIDALRAQGDAAFALWRSTVTAASLSEAIRAQASGSRQAYEAAASHWKDVAEAAGRCLASSMKPLQAVWLDRRR